MKRDKDLERIKLKKMKDLLNPGASRKEQKKPAPNKPVDVTDATVTEIVQNHSLVVIDCWAAWCAPCRMIAPVIEELASDYAGKIYFGKLNVDENRRTALQYQIMTIPTLLIFKNGKLIDRIIGAMSRPMLEPKITCYL